MNITLVKLPSLLAIKSLSYHASVAPLGLAYIAAILERYDHKIFVIDAVGEAPEKYEAYYQDKLFLHGLNVTEMVDRIPADTEVLGITSMFLHEYNLLRDFIHAAKQKYPHLTIIAGGENVTSLWEQMLSEFDGLDYCILGEGENKIVNLLESLAQEKDPLELEGVAARRNGEPLKSVLGKRIVSIDDIPWPAWHLFPLENYLAHQLSSGVNRGRSIPMLTSRGCPYSCKFCSSPDMWTTKYVARQPADVVEEIKFYVQRYQITNVDFHDLTAVLTKKWIKEFCELILENNIRISWQLPQGSRSEVITDETAQLLFLSGCRNYGFSPESGSERLIKSMKKNLKVDKILEAMRIAQKRGIKMHTSFIVGLPEEVYHDVWLSYKLIVRCAWIGVDSIAVMHFSPYPGSTYYDELRAENKIVFNDEYIYSSLLRASKEVKSYNARFKPFHLLLIQYLFLVTFFGLNYLLRPQRLFYRLRNLIQGKQEVIMDQFLNTKYKQIKVLMSEKNKGSKAA